MSNTQNKSILASSANPKEVSASWQGVGLTITGLILGWADTQSGGTLLGGTAAEEFAGSVVQVFLVVGGILRLIYGLLRKRLNK